MGEEKPRQYKIAKSVKALGTDRTQETVRSVSTDRVSTNASTQKSNSKKSKK